MTASPKISEIKSQLSARYSKLNKVFLGTEGKISIPLTPDDMGRHHFEFRRDGLISMIWTDRGRETKRLSTYEVDEVLYWLFREIVKERAMILELKNRGKTNALTVVRFGFQLRFKKCQSYQQNGVSSFPKSSMRFLRTPPSESDLSFPHHVFTSILSWTTGSPISKRLSWISGTPTVPERVNRL